MHDAARRLMAEIEHDLPDYGIPNASPTVTPHAPYSRGTLPDASATGCDREFKELVDKLSWAVGSTLHLSYSRKSPVRDWAVKKACYIVGLWRKEGSLDSIEAMRGG